VAVIRLPFTGPSYSPRSLAVGAQTLINLFAEEVENRDEQMKAGAVMYGSPGTLAFKDMATIDAGFSPLRGIWSGAGRVFVAGGTKYCEINSSGSLVGSVRTISNAAVNGLSNAPAQFFPNGNQLMVVSGGLAYIDNGSGPVAIAFSGTAGTVRTFGYGVSWESGNKFSPTIVGQTITINGVGYVVNLYYNDETIELLTTAGVQTGVAYTLPAPSLTALTGAYLDGYYILGRPNSRQYNISRLNNSTGAVWSGLDYSTKNSYPDNLACVLSNDDLYLFGQESTDVHRNTGGTFPFSKMDGASFRVGTASPWSPITINSRVFFIGISSQGRPVAYVLDGYTPVRISTHAEEYQWSAANLGTNCISYSEEHEGHYWWVINFGTQTWQYDLISGAWSQRAQWNGSAFTAYPFQFHTYVPEWGKHLVCGNSSSVLYESSLSIYDDNGSDICWQRTLPHFYANGKQQVFGRMTLEMQTGTVASGAAPTITRTWSDNRGQTFSNPETASIGVHDDFTLRVFWPGTSTSRDRVYRIQGAGKYKVALIALEMEYKVNRA
jgi:hypothetical protein